MIPRLGSTTISVGQNHFDRGCWSKCSTPRYQTISRSIWFHQLYVFTIEGLTDITRSFKLPSSQRFWGTPPSRDFEIISWLLCFVFDEGYCITGNLGCDSKFGCGGMLLGRKNRFSQYCIRETGLEPGSDLQTQPRIASGFIQMTHRSTSGYCFVQGYMGG